MKSINNIDKNFVLGGLCICIYMLPYIICGEDSYITIHDHLDSTIAHYQNIKANGLLFKHHGLVPIMCGIDRVYFSSYPYLELKLYLYSIMPMYWAIICSCFIWKVTAFVGMYLLLDNYIISKDEKWISFLSAIMFALIPFYVDYSLSSAGMPLLFYAFLNLLTNKKKLWIDYLLILYVGLNSSLALSGFFALIVLFLISVYYCRQMKKIPYNMLWGICFLTLIYLFTNLETLKSLFYGSDFVSHRTEFAHSTTLIMDLVAWLQIIALSQYHAGNLFSLPIFLFFVALCLRYNVDSRLRAMLLVTSVIITGSFLGVVGKSFGLGVFNSIQFDRFYFLYPSLFIVLFAKECSIVRSCKYIKKRWIVICGFLLVVPFIKEYRCFAERFLQLKPEMPTYSQFYDTVLFDQLKRKTGVMSDYSTKVVCLGLYPAVAEYNGLYTLDSYFYNYPLEYKQNFRKIIANEIDKSLDLKSYFDDWGSRCYIFSSEIGLNFMSEGYNTIEEFSIDINSLKKMGCQYIISAVAIGTKSVSQLKLVDTFTTSQSFWKIYLYQI